jgi:predicted AAA+ superfamily ATPase
MAAHFHGQVWRYSDFTSSLGLRHAVIKNYLDLLTDTFMVRQLPPWFENVGKTVVKSPKFYIRDSGIFHTLMGIQSIDDLRNHPKLGASWEGFALEQIIRLSRKSQYEIFFWATHSNAEIDLLINVYSEKWGFEVKYTDAPRRTRSMTIAANDLKLDRLYIIYPGRQAYFIDDTIQAIPLLDLYSPLTPSSFRSFPPTISKAHKKYTAELLTSLNLQDHSSALWRHPQPTPVQSYIAGFLLIS